VNNNYIVKVPRIDAVNIHTLGVMEKSSFMRRSNFSCEESRGRRINSFVEKSFMIFISIDKDDSVITESSFYHSAILNNI